MKIVKFFLKIFRRFLGLTPMCKVQRELKSHGVKLRRLEGLEVFGYTGEYRSQDYLKLIASLEVW